MKNGLRGHEFARPGGWQHADLPDVAEVPDWFAGRLPDDWFTGPPAVEIDRDEIVVIGELPLFDRLPGAATAAGAAPSSETAEPTGAQHSSHATRSPDTAHSPDAPGTPGPQPAQDGSSLEAGATDPLPAVTEIPRATRDGLVARFREDTRPARMQIGEEAQARYGRPVAWGVSVGGERTLFTHLSVPVMTRLRQPERKVLDTLVDAGVARSRADALSWTVKLAGKHAEDWLAELRAAMRKVDDLRAEGPRGL